MNENHDCSGPGCKRCKIKLELGEIQDRIFREHATNPLAGTAVVAAGLAMLIAHGVTVERALAVALGILADMREEKQ